MILLTKFNQGESDIFGGMKQSNSINESSSTPSEQNCFLQLLSNRVDKTAAPVCLSLFSSTSHQFETNSCVPDPRLPPSLRSFFSDSFDPQIMATNINKILNIKVTPSDINFIDNATKLQSLSPVWQDVRCGRITASVAHEVLHTNIEQPSLSLIKKICNPNYSISAPALNWGKDNEKKALEEFVLSASQDHVDTSISESLKHKNFCLDPNGKLKKT